MEVFNEEFLGNIVVMIIGLVILGIGAQVFIAGAYISLGTLPDVILMVILMIVGLILIGFGLRVLLDLITKIHRRLQR